MSLLLPWCRREHDKQQCCCEPLEKSWYKVYNMITENMSTKPNKHIYLCVYKIRYISHKNVYHYHQHK